MSESAYLTRAREIVDQQWLDTIDKALLTKEIASLLTQVRNETLEEAAKVCADDAQQCRNELKSDARDMAITTALVCEEKVRRLKTPALQVGTTAAPLSPGDEVQQSEAGEQA